MLLKCVRLIFSWTSQVQSCLVELHPPSLLWSRPAQLFVCFTVLFFSLLQTFSLEKSVSPRATTHLAARDLHRALAYHATSTFAMYTSRDVTRGDLQAVRVSALSSRAMHSRHRVWRVALAPLRLSILPSIVHTPSRQNLCHEFSLFLQSKHETIHLVVLFLAAPFVFRSMLRALSGSH